MFRPLRACPGPGVSPHVQANMTGAGSHFCGSHSCTCSVLPLDCRAEDCDPQGRKQIWNLSLLPAP